MPPPPLTVRHFSSHHVSSITSSMSLLYWCMTEVRHYVMVLTPVSFSARRIVNTGATFQRVTIMASLVYLLLCRRSIIGSCSSTISFWSSAFSPIHLLLADCSVTLVLDGFAGREVNSSVPGNSVVPCVESLSCAL